MHRHTYIHTCTYKCPHLHKNGTPNGVKIIVFAAGCRCVQVYVSPDIVVHSYRS